MPERERCHNAKKAIGPEILYMAERSILGASQNYLVFLKPLHYNVGTGCFLAFEYSSFDPLSTRYSGISGSPKGRGVEWQNLKTRRQGERSRVARFATGTVVNAPWYE